MSVGVATVETVQSAGPIERNPATEDGAADRAPALVLSGLLLVAGLLVGLSPVIGVVTSADASPMTASVLAAFVAVLPGALGVLLAVRRPMLGLAATAGGGAVGLIRLLADLAVISETDGVTRPELFVETTDRARPFAVGSGAWLLVTADVLMLVVGVLAASRLATALSSGGDPGQDALFGAALPESMPATTSTSGEADGAGADGDGDPGGVVVALSRPPPRRLSMNLPMVSLGFLGAILLMVAALEIPYSGGYLALRVIPLGSSLTGVLAAVLIVLLVAIIVVIAASLPRQLAQALLGGTAAAAAVPSLTAVVAVITGAPTGLSSGVWWGMAGAVILAAAGLLARGGRRRMTMVDGAGEPPRHWLVIGTGVLALLAAGALATASQAALMYIDGAAPDGLVNAVLQPAGPPLLVASVPLAVAGLAALIRPTAQIGRTGIVVLWAGAVYALGQVLWVRSRVLDSLGYLRNAGVDQELQHDWTGGPGLWLALIGTALAVAAAVFAVITARRTVEASPEVPDEGSLAESRSLRRWPAIVLTVLIVVALALPVYGYLVRPASSTLILGYELDTWGVWAIALAACGAVWAAALTRRVQVAVALLVAAAAVVVQPLLVPAVIQAEPGFAFRAGLWVGAVTVVALIVVAGYFAVVVGRIRLDDRPPLAQVLGADQTGGAGQADGSGRQGPASPPRSTADSKGR